MMIVPNRRAACEPFQSLSLEKEGRAFATVKEKTALLPLKVVMNTVSEDGREKYHVGDTVWVRGDVKTMAWVKEVFEIAGQKFILVPEECIQVHFVGRAS